MPAPSIVGVSSSELNISWPQPLDSEIRGVVTQYRLYQYVTINDPFAPPEIQQVSFLCSHEFSMFHVKENYKWQGGNVTKVVYIYVWQL